MCKSKPKSSHRSKQKQLSLFQANQPANITNPTLLNELAEIRVTFHPTGKDPVQITGTHHAAQVLRSIWPDDLLLRERFYMLTLNRANRVLGYYQISSGGVHATTVDPKLIFGTALRILTCSAIILAHNHPSGDPAPSKADITLTSKLHKAGKMLDMNVLDHLVLAQDCYYSFRENKLL